MDVSDVKRKCVCPVQGDVRQLYGNEENKNIKEDS